jgi:hypothetical protein
MPAEQRSERHDVVKHGSVKHGWLRTLAVVGGVAALTLVGLQTGAGTAQAHPGLYYQRGLYLDNGWLCRGWSNGSYHCTRHWHIDRAGHLISDNQRWVPTGVGVGVGSTSGRTRGSGSTGGFRVSYSGSGVGLAPEPCNPHVPGWVWTSVNFRAPGAVPPGCYSGVYWINPRNYVYRPYFGDCNWWPEVMRPDEPGIPYSRAYVRHRAPRVGATIVYRPGEQGAGSTGHYGHVEAVSPDGRWVLTSEMNFYWRGGGFGKVVYRYARVTSGTTFIY